MISMNAEASEDRRLSPSLAAWIVVVDDETSRAQFMVKTLKSRGFQAVAMTWSRASGSDGKSDSPRLLIVSESAVRAGLMDRETLRRAKNLGIPILALLDDETDPITLTGPLRDLDDWLSVGNLDRELAARAELILRRREQSHGPSSAKAATATLDESFLALIIHDIRNPLNVIKLTLRLLSQSLPKGDPNLEEDLKILDENEGQIESILGKISDYMKLCEGAPPLPAIEFSPARLVDELIEERAGKVEFKIGKVVCEPDPGCPAKVALDPRLARLAIQSALENATSAVGSLPIRLRMKGGPDRWQTLITVDRAPPTSVKPHELSARSFERICGTERERRGLDLAIAARVSQIFGGSARLEVVPGEHSTIVLDWPARLNPVA